MSLHNCNFWENFNKHIDREKNGVWIELFGAKFKVRLHIANNLDFSKLLQKDEKLRGLLDSSRKDYSRDKSSAECLGKFIITDWENFQCPVTGKDLPFSREKCIEIMREFPDLASKIELAMSHEELKYENGLNSTKKN